MSKDDSRKQKLIRAPNALISRVTKVAHREGKTVFSYITEVFEQAIRAYDMNKSLEEIIDHYEMLRIHKEAGAIFTNRDILDYMIGKTYGENGESLENLWYQTGRWYGIFLNARFDDPLKAFLRFLREGRWDLNEVNINSDNEIVEFRAVSAFLSKERTLLTKNFIEGAMHSLGYKTHNEDCYKGIMRLEFSI